MKLIGYVGPGRGFDSGERVWPKDLPSKLGFTPFKGTLNVAIRPVVSLASLRGIGEEIDVFDDMCGFRGFFEGLPVVFCYSKKRAEHRISTLYVIAACKLRDVKDLEDGRPVQIVIGR